MLIEIVKEGSSAVQSAVVALEKLCSDSAGKHPPWCMLLGPCQDCCLLGFQYATHTHFARLTKSLQWAEIVAAKNN